MTVIDQEGEFGFASSQMNVALVSGTSINRSGIFDDWSIETRKTPYGSIGLKRKGSLIVANRHGFEDPLPPHRSPYHAYVFALKDLGVDSVVALSSVGSLRESLPPGTFVSCGDYLSFAPVTFVDDRPSGFAPRLDNGLLDELAPMCPSEIVADKIYAQTRGPRFETRVEVRILRGWGCDVVGMTFANEADLLLESGISVTSLCMIDNFAHGLGEKKLTMGEFHDAVGENQMKIDAFLEAFVARFGA